MTEGQPSGMEVNVTDDTGRNIVWPGQDTWGPEDGAAKQNDRQIALEIALKTINAQDNSTNINVRDNAERDAAYYEGLTGDARAFVDQAMEDIRARAEEGIVSEAAAASELIQQAA